MTVDAGGIVGLDRSHGAGALGSSLSIGSLRAVGLEREGLGSGFADVLKRAEEGGAAGGGAEDMDMARAREAAAEFVAVTLVQPILASLRDTNESAEPFAPGEAERAFGPMLDAEIAERIVLSARFSIVDVIAKQLVGRGNSAGGARARLEVEG